MLFKVIFIEYGLEILSVKFPAKDSANDFTKDSAKYRSHFFRFYQLLNGYATGSEGTDG